MTGESKIIDAQAGASGSASFTTHNSDRILVRVVPSTGEECNVTIYGVATSIEADTGTELDSATAVDSTGYLANLENTPVYKVTVAWDSLTGGTVSAFAWVGGV